MSHALPLNSSAMHCIAATLLLCGCASDPRLVTTAPPLPIKAADERLAAIEAICSRWNRPDSPGCVVGVIRDGEIVHVRCFGMANLELAVPISPGTVFDIASTSKQFTAACIGLLEQDGALSADDDLRRWIPELPDYGAKITLRHLMHHTSGLRDYLELFLFAGRKTEDYTTSAQALAMLVRQKKLNFEPGTEHLYSNSGYFLLSVVVERASGKSLAAFAKQRVFDPLGMSDTHYRDDHTELVPHRATAYASRAGGRFGINMSDFEQTGDGGVMTTVADLAKWDANFYTRRVGGEALQRFLHERGRLNDGGELDYARGLTIDTFRGLERESHGGGWAGYRAQLMRFPTQRFSVICLCNLGSIDPSDVCVQVASTWLKDAMNDEPRSLPGHRAPDRSSADRRAVPVLTPEQLAAFAGIYECAELETRAEIVVRQDHLVIGEVGLPDFSVAPEGPNRFGAWGVSFEFTHDERGGVAGFSAGSGRMRNLWFERLRR